MSQWRPAKKQLKRYPHFDDVMSPDEIQAYVNDKSAVGAHPFLPFILFNKQWQPYRGKAPRPEKKTRPIRYAARRDAYIFMRYRSLLAELYERRLETLRLSESVIAYRKIPVGGGSLGGKCNIHFAKDAFETIRSMGDCSALVLDISSYFESLDHARLKAAWADLIGEPRLPADHWAVYRAVTKYSVVDRQAVYERLGYYGEKRKLKNGKPINGYLMPMKKMPRRLCTLKDFKQKIVGGDPELPSLIQVNGRDFGKPSTGIPQGSPISDLLANLYLIDFDRRVYEHVRSMGGCYYRYSDDIIVILPGDATNAIAIKQWLQDLIKEYGPHLEIKDKKTSIAEFRRAGDHLGHRRIDGKGNNGLEYLGFRFDGKRVYIRDGTLAGLARKVSSTARIEAARWVARYPGKDVDWLTSNFNYEVLTKKFGRVEDFEEIDDVRKWTFWTYVQRASEIFGPLGKRIIPQVSGHRSLVRRRMEQAIIDAYAKSVRAAV